CATVSLVYVVTITVDTFCRSLLSLSTCSVFLARVTAIFNPFRTLDCHPEGDMLFVAEGPERRCAMPRIFATQKPRNLARIRTMPLLLSRSVSYPAQYRGPCSNSDSSP